METTSHTRESGNGSSHVTTDRSRARPQRRAASLGDGRGDGGTSQSRKDGLANALGWFSIGLGLAQVAAPRSVARLIGLDDDEKSISLMRTIGLRELASGVGILTQPQPAGWMWSRVAGDVMDLALLGRAMQSEGTERNRTLAATAAVLGVAALDVLSGQRLTESSRSNGQTSGQEEKGHGIRVRKSITVAQPVDEVYRFWRDFQNLPRFMRHLESVTVLDDRRSQWRAHAPAGMSVEWEAEMTEDQPNELISWRSLPGSSVENEGTVRFRPAPGGRGTELSVDLRYDPPGGKLTANLAKLFHEEPGQQVNDDLRTFKQVMETGEVVISDATIRRGPHPARPSTETVEI
jgi:uncharacterized membrane protein